MAARPPAAPGSDTPARATRNRNPAQGADPLIKLIYVSGSGRSGSTLLERILHSSEGMFALGEFHCLWRLPPAELTCSCGNNFGADDFWHSVMAKASVGSAEVSELQALERVVARSKFIASKGFRLETLRADPQVQRYLALQERVFEAIAEMSGRSILVDTSKAGPRAWLMACRPDTSLVHLWRDPTDVIASWRSKKFDKGLGTYMQRLSIRVAAQDWLKVEYFARRLGRLGRVHFLAYDQVCQHPQQTIEDTLQAVLGSQRPVPHWLGEKSFQPSASYHSLNGNPDRFESGQIHISYRAANLDQFGVGERMAIKSVSRLLRWIFPAPS